MSWCACQESAHIFDHNLTPDAVEIQPATYELEHVGSVEGLLDWLSRPEQQVIADSLKGGAVDVVLTGSIVVEVIIVDRNLIVV